MKTKRVSIAVFFILLVNCGGGNSSIVANGNPAGAPAHTTEKRARLVVAIVYDQFPAWAYARYRSLLSPQGALRRARQTGADHVVRYAYAGTYTAAGHTAIYTGVPPAQSGVGSNRVWTPKRGNRSVVDDGKYKEFGKANAYASPTVVKVDTVADALRAAYGDKVKIVSLSLKDRGAVLPAGRKPDLVLWYEKKLGTMTTSAYYGDKVPAWVSSWLKQHPISNYFKDWTPGDPATLKQMLGPDDAPGEGNYRGFGTTFPHNPVTTMDPKRTFRLMPDSSYYLLDLARAAVAKLDMGKDDVPDLLLLSLSSTDYVGHAFGGQSWEYVDHLVKVDAAVGKFLAELEKHTDVAVLLTSDHGAAPLPERVKDKYPNAGRIFPDELPGKLNAVVSKVVGKGKWVGAYVPPFVYLNRAARAPDKRDKVIAAVIAALDERKEVYAAYETSKARTWAHDKDPIKRAVARAIPATGIHGAVFLVPAPGSVTDEEFPKGKGTSHGTPWEYDRRVEAVFAGPGVKHDVTTAPLHENRVAATLCKLLGIAPPAQLKGVAPLPGL